MHQMKRFVFWQETLVTTPSVEATTAPTPRRDSKTAAIPDGRGGVRVEGLRGRQAAGSFDSADSSSTGVQRWSAQHAERSDDSSADRSSSVATVSDGAAALREPKRSRAALKRDREDHKGIKAIQITCATGGLGFLLFGSADGRLTVVDAKYRLARTPAYSRCVTHVEAVQFGNGIIVSIGDGFDPRSERDRILSSRISRHTLRGNDSSPARESAASSISSSDGEELQKPRAVVKIWQVQAQPLGREMGPAFPLELVFEFPVFNVSFPEATITAVAVLEDMSQIAVGLDNGAVMLLMEPTRKPLHLARAVRRRIILPNSPPGPTGLPLHRVTNILYSYSAVEDDLASAAPTTPGDGGGGGGGGGGGAAAAVATGTTSNSNVGSGSGSGGSMNNVTMAFHRRPSQMGGRRIASDNNGPVSGVTLFVTTGFGRGNSPEGLPGDTALPTGQLVSFAHVEQAYNESVAVPGIILDETGTDEGCCTINDSGYAAVARENGLFLYSAEDPGPCYWVDSPKSFVHWHESCVLLVTNHAMVQRISIYDLRHKITAFTKNLRNAAPTPRVAGATSAASRAVSTSSSVSSSTAANSASGTKKPRSGSGMMTPLVDPSLLSHAALMKSDGEVRHVIHEWGKLFVITSTHRVFALEEKPTRTKVEELERKHLYHIALSLAVNDMERDIDFIMEICKNYGDHLYDKGDYEDAVQQYINCGVYVEPSHVIRKFLEANRMDCLTEFLEALHEPGRGATSEHTTLLLNCFTQQQNVEKLRSFIGYIDDASSAPGQSRQHDEDSNNEISHSFDVSTAIRVLHHTNFVDEASFLARSHRKHDEYLRIQLENVDGERARRAREYISALGFLDAEHTLKMYGKTLMDFIPDETTEVLMSICTPSLHNSEDEGEIVLQSDPEEFIALFVDHQLHLKRFLWHVAALSSSTLSDLMHRRESTMAAALDPTTNIFSSSWGSEGLPNTAGASGSGDLDGRGDNASQLAQYRRPASTLVWNTLLELCLNRDVAILDVRDQQRRRAEAAQKVRERDAQQKQSAQAAAPMPSMHRETMIDALIQEEAMVVLKDVHSRYDPDHALVLVQQYQFEDGMMYLYEKRKMYHMLIQRHMDSGNHRAIIATCRKYGQRDPNLWVKVLTFLVNSYGEGGGKDQHCAIHIQQILREAAAFLPPLLVIEIMSKNPKMPVSVVDEYLIQHLQTEQSNIEEDEADINRLRTRIDSINEEMHNLETSAQVFNHTNDQLFTATPLSLPVVHFMSGNSYNLDNVDMDAYGHYVDPKLVDDHQRLDHMITDLQSKSQKHEDFYREMQMAGREGSGSGFDKVAEYFGLGVFSSTAQKANRRTRTPSHSASFDALPPHHLQEDGRVDPRGASESLESVDSMADVGVAVRQGAPAVRDEAAVAQLMEKVRAKSQAHEAGRWS